LKYGSKFLPEIFELTLLNNKYFKLNFPPTQEVPKIDNVLNNAQRLPVTNFMALNKFLSDQEE